MRSEPQKKISRSIFSSKFSIVLLKIFPQIVLMMITCLMYDSVVCGHAHENLLQLLFTLRVNYIHLMCEFVSRPETRIIVHCL